MARLEIYRLRAHCAHIHCDAQHFTGQHDYSRTNRQSQRKKVRDVGWRPNAERDDLIDISHYVALVIEVGVVASFSVNVNNVDEPSVFFTVTVVLATERSSMNCVSI